MYTDSVGKWAVITQNGTEQHTAFLALDSKQWQAEERSSAAAIIITGEEVNLIYIFLLIWTELPPVRQMQTLLLCRSSAGTATTGG